MFFEKIVKSVANRERVAVPNPWMSRLISWAVGVHPAKAKTMKVSDG